MHAKIRAICSLLVAIYTLCAFGPSSHVVMGQIVGGYDLNPKAGLMKQAEPATSKFGGDGQVGGSERENKKLSKAERAICFLALAKSILLW